MILSLIHTSQIKAIEEIHRATKDHKNERSRIRNKASRERVRQGNPTQSDLNFVAAQKASSYKWVKNNPEKSAKSKSSWARRNPEKVAAAVQRGRERKKLKRQQTKKQNEQIQPNSPSPKER